MSRFRTTIVTASSRSRLLAGVLAVAIVSPAPASAFFQQTKLEGVLGTDIGGVWLSVQQVMPEFRINYPKPATGPAIPVVVGPIPADLEPLTGKDSPGVVIQECTNAGFCSENGILVGDVVIKVNSTDIANVADFEKASQSAPAAVLLSVRRPALKMTTVRLLKLKYAAVGKEAAGESLQQESLDLKVLDVELPFSAALEKTRRTHEFFQPSAAELEALSKTWFQLPLRSPATWTTANHRFAAQAAFDEALASDKSLTKAKYAILMSLDGNPAQGGGGKLIDLYGVESMDTKTMDGNYVSVTIANAPFPINIEFKGRFHMTKIADWSDQDDKLRAANQKPAEDLSKYKTLPDVPPPAKPAPKAH